MKKALIIILFLFLLSGCNKQKEILGVSRIDESMVCDEYCLLDLKVISSNKLEDIQVDNIYSDITYDYQVTNSNQNVKLNNNLEKNIYSYDLKIKVYNPVSISNIDLKINKQKYTFDIGSFSCLSKEYVLNENNGHLKCNIDVVNELNDETVCHKIKLENLTDRPILVKNIKQIENIKSEINICKAINQEIIKPIDQKCMAYSYVKSNNLYKLNYLIQVEYMYNGENYTTCFNIYDDDIIQSVSNVGSYILVDELCFGKSS